MNTQSSPQLWPAVQVNDPSLPADPSRRSHAAVKCPRAPRRREIDLREPNARGRHRLIIEYRPQSGWQPARCETAEELLIEYFRLFGGFRRAGRAIIRAWYEALEDYSAQEIRWALQAKASSLEAPTPDERRAKRIYVAHPRTAPLHFGQWLSWHPEYQRRLAAQQPPRSLSSGFLSQRLTELAAEEEALARGEIEAVAQRRAARQAEHQRSIAQRRAADDQFWGGLSDAQRSAALLAVRSEFVRRIRQWGENPEDPKFDDMLRSWKVDWARQKWPPAASRDSVGAGTPAGLTGAIHLPRPRGPALTSD